MNFQSKMMHLDLVRQMDPDAIVDMLDITTEELLDHQPFLTRALRWIEEEYGE